MTSPDLSDLTVFADGSDQHLDYYTVFSGLTRGRCAEVAVSRSNHQGENPLCLRILESEMMRFCTLLCFDVDDAKNTRMVVCCGGRDEPATNP